LPVGKDVSDWIAQGGTREQLDTLIEQAPDWTKTEEQTSKATIPLTFFDDCGKQISKAELIKGIIGKNETSTWIGPPGSGKSALLITVGIALAGPMNWYGSRTKERCGVIHFAFERADLCKRRLHAHRMRDNLPSNLPIAIYGRIINLMDPKSVDDMILPAIHEAEQRFCCRVGFASFDTYNKGIAFGGGDEDKAKDQNRALANLRHLQERHDGLHVALAGHTGKDESRGARGSNALPGDADMENQLSIQGDVKIVSTTKANDAPIGELLRFRLQPYEIGTDDDGDPITIWIASNEIIEKQSQSTAKPQRLTPDQRNALNCLVQVAAGGISAPHSLGLPPGFQVTTMDVWKAELLRRGVIEKGHSNPRQAFKHYKETLQAKGLLAVDGDYIWPTKGDAP
jgi:hypothetical protein